MDTRTIEVTDLDLVELRAACLARIAVLRQLIASPITHDARLEKSLGAIMSETNSYKKATESEIENTPFRIFVGTKVLVAISTDDMFQVEQALEQRISYLEGQGVPDNALTALGASRRALRLVQASK